MNGFGATGLAALACVLVAAPAVAETPSPARPASDLAQRAADTAREQARREDRLRAIEERLRSSAEARGRLEREIAGLASDRAALAAALLATATRAREAEERAAATEGRLDALAAEEDGIRQSLESRREVLSGVLAALQRIGLKPPPAILVRADDVLAAMRASQLLAALTPNLRNETVALAKDLERRAALRRSVAADRTALEAEFAGLAAERERLAGLVRARQERLSAIERDARGERSRGETLGGEARSLKDLIERMDGEVEAARRAAAEAERAAEALARETRERFASAAAREPARLAPRQSFADARGLLSLPASGRVLRGFGDDDGSGGALRGTALATRPRATVTSPADGSVVFAGPFRSYGRLLIINAGGGYYLLLAGMVEISVEIGQFVLAGEPVGRMGEVASPSAALGVAETDGPVLFVEIRKDGGSIDPGPWWAKTQGERARG